MRRKTVTPEIKSVSSRQEYCQPLHLCGLGGDDGINVSGIRTGHIAVQVGRSVYFSANIRRLQLTCTLEIQRKLPLRKKKKDQRAQLNIQQSHEMCGLMVFPVKSCIVYLKAIPGSPSTSQSPVRLSRGPTEQSSPDSGATDCVLT